jgi:hypothetical protein
VNDLKNKRARNGFINLYLFCESHANAASTHNTSSKEKHADQGGADLMGPQTNI